MTTSRQQFAALVRAELAADEAWNQKYRTHNTPAAELLAANDAYIAAVDALTAHPRFTFPTYEREVARQRVQGAK